MFSQVIGNLLIALNIMLAFYGCYFAVVAVTGLIKKRAPLPLTAPKHKFAVVVAARNEAAVIGHLVDSLNEQNYPKELYEVIVAPNNCTDDTEQVALAHGARIFNHTGAVKSKGDVLSQVVDKVVFGEDFDAMCVFDADNLADGNFLQSMNNVLCSGLQVAQGLRDSKNPRQSPVSGCTSIWYWMLNCFFNRGRAALGLSALITGCGFMVSSEMLRKNGGWHTGSITEDYEFSAQCALSGTRVAFVPEAHFYDEQPLTFAQSRKQCYRWATGGVQSLQAYGYSLFSAAVLKRNRICIDMFLTLLGPLVQLLSAIAGIGGFIMLLSKGFVFFGLAFKGLGVALLVIAATAVFYMLGSGVIAIVTMLLQRVPLRGMGSAIVTFWLFLAGWIFLTVFSFVRKETKWQAIAHTSATQLSDMHL